MPRLVRLLLLPLALVAHGESLASPPPAKPDTADTGWAQKAVWYQIFPERFRNGDPKNDPTAEYARVPNHVRSKWRIVGLRTSSLHNLYGRLVVLMEHNALGTAQKHVPQGKRRHAFDPKGHVSSHNFGFWCAVRHGTLLPRHP